MKEQFSEALQGKRIPILTLDNKWYRLLDEDARKRVAGTEARLNDLLKRQGKLNTETKDIKKMKKKLMGEIVSMADQVEQGNTGMEKKLEQHKKLVEECNERLEEYQDELMDLPREIDRVNFELMLATMDSCYGVMQENTKQIGEISKWVENIRVELKKQLVRKQMMEQRNHAIYSYMHDVFGAEVLELFDLTYDPEEQHPK